MGAGRARNRLFRVAYALFDGRPLLTVPTPRATEDRFLSIGPDRREILRGHMDVARRSSADYHGKEGQKCGRRTIPCAIRLNKSKPGLRAARTGRVGTRLTR